MNQAAIVHLHIQKPMNWEDKEGSTGEKGQGKRRVFENKNGRVLGENPN